MSPWKRFSFIVWGAILVSLIPAATQAITVSPVLFDFDIQPGSSQQAKITVVNDSNETQSFTLHTQNFIASGEEGSQEYLQEEQPSDLASWVIPDQPTIQIDPGASRDFPFLISVPEHADPGGHYATIFFTRAPGASGESGVGIAEQVGVLLLVNVPGDIVESIEVDSFRVKHTVVNRLPAEFEFRLRNLGSVHERPKGTLVIRNILGSVVARVPGNPNKSAILPNSVRRIDSGWAHTLDIPEDRGFWAETKNEWKNFAIGRYTASIDMTYGSNNVQIPVHTVSFWVLPWHLMLLALLGLVGIVLLIMLYNNLLVRAALKKSQAS
ncbi:DUF916 domain-containing protein [Candidatus Uhrbacteria bacterium UHB]|jgi:hypothetical protein|nr:DUF916 domain-containing protein [Candidatus Uhrbacteria bacterium UHB]RIL00131.1 MAG: hypothetical protein DCC77_04550 [Candidatus Uhrbacteria bacterium]